MTFINYVHRFCGIVYNLLYRHHPTTAHRRHCCSRFPADKFIIELPTNQTDPEAIDHAQPDIGNTNPPRNL